MVAALDGGTPTKFKQEMEAGKFNHERHERHEYAFDCGLRTRLFHHHEFRRSRAKAEATKPVMLSLSKHLCRSPRIIRQLIR